MHSICGARLFHLHSMIPVPWCDEPSLPCFNSSPLPLSFIWGQEKWPLEAEEEDRGNEAFESRLKSCHLAWWSPSICLTLNQLIILLNFFEQLNTKVFNVMFNVSCHELSIVNLITLQMEWLVTSPTACDIKSLYIQHPLDLADTWCSFYRA